MNNLLTKFVCSCNFKHFRKYGSCRGGIQVTVCGGGGGIGQPLSLLLKMSPLISKLNVYDIKDSLGAAVDLSHINTNTKVRGFVKADQIDDSLNGSHIVIITAGAPRKPGMERAGLFDTNASIVKEITHSISKTAPHAFLAIVTNPVNSLVPVVAEVLKKSNVYNKKKLFGVTTLDIVRASTFTAKELCLDPCQTLIPVIGGHSGKTIVPVLSQAKPKIDLPKDRLIAIIERIQNAGTEVVEAKSHKGSATLSMAYAAARFVFALCRAIKGEPNIIECAYVQSDITEAKYFATPLLLGAQGIQKNLGFGKLKDYECTMVRCAIKELIKEIELGEAFMRQKPPGK